MATNDTGVIDISGTYTSEITHKDTWGYAQQLPRHYFGKNSNIVVNIKQNGNIITGTMSGHSTGVIEGVIKGNEIIFDWEMKPRRSGGIKFGKGIWVVSGDQVTLNGTWKSGSSASNAQPNGIWNLTKIESDAAPIPDISGTYIAETTYSGPNNYTRGIFKKMNGKLIVLKQTGNTITGSVGSRPDWIKGTREGNIINFYILGSNEIIGSWEFSADATNLEGN